MIYLKISCDDGNWWITGFNGTYSEAHEYFMGLRHVSHECEETGKETFSTVTGVRVL